METAGCSAELQTPNSGVVVRPIILSPAIRILDVRNVSAVARLPRISREPISCSLPFIVGPRSFIRNGRPAKDPSRFTPSFPGALITSSKISLTPDTDGFTLPIPTADYAPHSHTVRLPSPTR